MTINSVGMFKDPSCCEQSSTTAPSESIPPYLHFCITLPFESGLDLLTPFSEYGRSHMRMLLVRLGYQTMTILLAVHPVHLLSPFSYALSPPLLPFPPSSLFPSPFPTPHALPLLSSWSSSSFSPSLLLPLLSLPSPRERYTLQRHYIFSQQPMRLGWSSCKWSLKNSQKPHQWPWEQTPPLSQALRWVQPMRDPNQPGCSRLPNPHLLNHKSLLV